MKNRAGITIVLPLLLASAVGAIWSSGKADDIAEKTALSEVLYIPSPRTVKAMSLGYSGLMADVYWTRVVQYFGNKHIQSPDSYKLLAPLLEITTTLDPQLDIAYQFGAFFLAQQPPQGAGMPDAAVELVRKGIAANPSKWRLYYDLGFIYWMEKHDYKNAADAFEVGSRVPGAMPWMKVMAASMALGANDAAAARTLWTEILKDSTEKNMRWNATRRLMCLDSDDLVKALQPRVDLYRERTGRIPTFKDLVAAGLLRRVPIDPAGNPYEIDEYGQVVVSNLRELPFVTKGLLHGETPNIVGLPISSQPQAGTKTPGGPDSPPEHDSRK